MAMTRRGGLAAAALGVGSVMLGASGVRAANGSAVIEVRGRPGETQGQLRIAGRAYGCSLGRAGIFIAKHEGDGSTPMGRFALRELRYRADRIALPATGLSAHPILANDGWCDDPADRAYNRLVSLPYSASAETLTRDDHLYDALVVIGFNDAPVRPAAGSAIFLHVARGEPGALEPTAGCVALTLEDLREVLAHCRPTTEIDIALI